MPTGGWISTQAFQDDVLSADTDGRASMEDGFVVNAKIAAATITASRCTTSFFLTGVYGVGVYGTAIYG